MILRQKHLVLVLFTAIEPDNGVEILQLPVAPLVLGAVHHGIIVAGVDEQYGVQQMFRFTLIQKPQRTGQAFGVEEIVAHAHHHVHMAGLNELFTDVLVFALTVGSRGRHHKTRTAMLVQVRVEIGHPQIVCVADLLGLVHTGQAKGQPPGTLRRLRLNLVHVKRRICHHIVAAAVQVVGIVIEGIGFIAGLDHAGQTMHGHIHQAELGVVLHLFLSVEGHSVVGDHARMVYKVAGLHKHTAAAASRVQQNAVGRLQHIDDHFHQRFRRKEHAVILCHIFGKLIQKVLVDTADHIAAHIDQRIIVEDAQQFPQQFIREDGVVLRQNALQLLALLLHQFHGVVHHFAQTVQRVTLDAGQPLLRDVGGQIDQVIVLRLLGQKQCTLFGKVALLHRQHPATAHGTVFQDLLLYQFEAAVRIPQKNQSQHRHTVLVRGEFRACTQQICRLPQVSFQFFDVHVVGHEGIPPVVWIFIFYCITFFCNVHL